MGHRGEPVLEVSGEFMRALGNPCFAALLVERERLRQRPQMLEGLVPAGSHSTACSRSGRFSTGKPGLPHLAINEARDGWEDRVPAPSRSGDNSRPPWSEQPLVAARDEEVAAEIGEVLPKVGDGRGQAAAG